MKIEFTQIKTDGHAVELVAQIIFPLEEFEKAGNNTYERKALFNQVRDKITEIIAAEYIEAKRNDILTEIDLDQIVKGVQFKTINEFAKPGSVGGM